MVRFLLCLLVALAAHVALWQLASSCLFTPRTKPVSVVAPVSLTVVHEELAATPTSSPEPAQTAESRLLREPVRPPVEPIRCLVVAASPHTLDMPVFAAELPAPAPDPALPAAEPSPASLGADEATVVSEVVAGTFKVVYPRSSRRRGEEGAVTLEIRVGADGRAADTRVITSSGYRALDSAACTAARAATYSAAGTLTLTVEFRLR